mgnify:CR=1 FL=1
MPSTILMNTTTSVADYNHEETRAASPVELTYINRYNMGTELKSVISGSLGKGDFEIHYACGGAPKETRGSC